MAEKFKLTKNFTPNTEKRAIFRPTENFQFSDEIKKKWATADAERQAKKALSGIAGNISGELKNGITSGKGIAKPSKQFDAYVNGNPVPHINPQGGVIGTKKEAEEYAKKATAGDGFEGLSLEELKKRLDAEEEVYERSKGNIITNTLDFIGSDWFSKDNSFGKSEDYKDQYNALKNAYENRKAAYTDYTVSKKYGVGNAEEAITLLKKRKKSEKSDVVKQNIDEEIKTIREDLYGKGSKVKATVKGLTDTGFKQFLSLQAKTMDATLGNVARAFGFKNNIFSQTNDYYRNLYEQSHREQERLAMGAGDKYNISGSIGEGVSAALPDAAASSVIAILTGGASVAPQLGKAATGIRAALQSSIKNMAKNPFYWSSFVQTYGSDFEDAKASGANDAVASLYAVLNSSLNAAVEVGGGTGNAGIQSLPEALKNAAGNKSAVLEWVKSSLDEGKEEVVQGVITQLNSGLFFDRNKEIYSSTNEDAVFNPSRMLQEGAMGAAVGAVLGSGQMTFSAIANAKTNAEWRAIGEVAERFNVNADGLAKFAAKSLNPETRALGITALNENNISTETIGKLYSYACKSIGIDIFTPENINEVSENFNNIMESADSKSIQDIASAYFVTKLTELGIDEESADYMATGGITENAENSVLQSTAETEDHSEVFHEPDTKDIAETPDLYDAVNEKLGGKPARTTAQLHIERVANNIGLNVSWDNSLSRGKYIPSERRIVINPNLKTSEMYNFVLKHEFTHYLESKKGYDGFKDYAFEKSGFFEKWARERLEKSGLDSTGSREEVISRLVNAEYEAYRNSGELSKIMRDRFTTANAEAEVLADFVGDNLLGSGDRLDITLEELSKLNGKQPGIIQRIREFVRDMINRFKGNGKFKSLVSDLEYLNKRLEEAARSKDKKSSDNQTEKYSISESFEQEYDNWDKKDPRKVFTVGSTSEVLKNLGIDERPITWDASKIIKIKAKHPEMTDSIIKQVPDILENPIIVMRSKNTQTRLTMFGEVYADGKPVLAVAELQPNGRNGLLLDEIKIASAYGKDKAQNFINNSEVLYLEDDKKRVSNWEMRTGLQLPVGVSVANSNSSISNSAENVKTENSNGFNKRLEEAVRSKDKKSSDNQTEKYSIAYTTDNKPVAVIDEDILDGVPKSQWIQTVKDTISEKFSDGIPISGRLIKVNQKTRNEFTNSKNSQWYAKNNQVIYADKFKSANNLDDIVLASTNYINEDLKHNRKDKFTEFARGDVLIRVGKTDYSAKVIVGFTSGKQMILYDVIDFSPTSFEIKKTDMRSPSNRINAENGSNISVSDITVPQNEQSVNTNISENAQNDTEEHSIAALSSDKLLDMYDKGEISRDEFLTATDSRSKQIAMEYVKQWDKKAGEILKNKEKLEAEREKAVREERKYQEEKKSRQSNINTIRRTVRKIDHALRANAHSKHIPEAYRNAATEFCKLFVDNDKPTFVHKELANIYSYYEALKGKGGNADAPQYDPFIAGILKDLVENVDGKRLTELDNDTLIHVGILVDAFNRAVNTEAQVFIDNKKVAYTEAGNAAIDEISKIKTVPLDKALNNKKLESLRGFLYEGNMTPAYFLKRMGPQFEKIYDMLIKGQGRWARNMQTSKDFVTGLMTRYDYKNWKNQTVEFRTESGRNLTLTVNQALQLVATAEREKSNNGQTSKHLSLGGVVIDTETLKNAIKQNNKVDKIKGKDAKETADLQNKKINEILDSLRARAIQISFEDVKVVEALLTNQQKSYMKEMVDFLSTQCAVWGNEVTMELYGYRQFLETNYFPYQSADVFLAKDPARADSVIMRSASFTKSLQKNASNPLALSSFTDVALQHIESMCNYNSITVPLDTLNKVFNYQTEGGGNPPVHSVKSEIENKFGKKAVEYMQNFIKDLNTGVRGDQRDSVLNSLTSKFKKSAVLANLSVVLQQPSAIFRGLRDIDGKYYLKAPKYYSDNNYEECKRYAEVAIIKEMGRFDTGMGVKNTSWLSDDGTFREKLDDKLGAAAGKADEVAWSFLWSAVKAEIADTTDLKVGSDEFLTKAGERFTQVVNETQVYDSILVKSQNMRNKGALGAITSFAAEPTLTVNMLVNSYIDFREGKANGKKLARTVMSVVVADIINSALQSIVTAARDDDDDKSYAEKYLGNLVENSLGNLSIFAKIPYVRDLKSIYDGYDVERQDTAVFADFIEAVKATGSKTKTPLEKTRKLAEAAANIFGVPLKNVLRDAEAVARTFWNFAFDDITDENGNKSFKFHIGEDTTADGIKVSMLEGISENNILKPWHIDHFDYSKNGEYKRMANALKKGDEKAYQKSYDRLIKGGAEDSTVRAGVIKQFKDDKTVKKQTDKYLNELKGNSTFKGLSADDKEKLGKDISAVLAKKEMVNSSEHKPSEYEKLYKLYCTDKAGYKAMRTEMLKSGKTEKQINDGFEIAKYAYLQSVGIDLHKYLLYKLSSSEKYADTDGSGGVSKSEKKEALNKMDIDEKTRQQIRQYLLENN